MDVSRLVPAIVWLAVAGCLEFSIYLAFGWPSKSLLDWIAAVAVTLFVIRVATDLTRWLCFGGYLHERQGRLDRLIMTPAELHPELEAAALRYAAMSPADFVEDTLVVSSTRLRNLGMIDTDTWARVPAGGDVRVKRNATGALSARVMLPWQ